MRPARAPSKGMHIVTPVMFALISANVLNAVANWLLVYGNLGFPALGVAGSAWATLIARVYLFGAMAAAIWWFNRDGLWHMPQLIDSARLGRLSRLGLPAASQILAQVGVFALATALAGTLDPISSASHQIALNLAGAAFMIPLGVGSAATVCVGHAVGAGDVARAARFGWTAILIGATFASGAAIVAMPRTLIGLFSPDAAVSPVGTSLALSGRHLSTVRRRSGCDHRHVARTG